MGHDALLGSGLSKARKAIQVGNVIPRLEAPRTVKVLKAVEGRVLAHEPPSISWKNAEYMLEKPHQKASMSHCDDSLSGMTAGHLPKDSDAALESVLSTFSLRNSIAVTAVPVSREFDRKSPRHLLLGEAFKDAHMPLPKARIFSDLDPRCPGDRLGGVNGAAEVAAVENREALSTQSVRQCPRLRNASFGQRTVTMPLFPTLDVPLRLAVPDRD